MIEIVTPHPQFLSVTERAALAALGLADPDNPITIEIARLVTAYTSNFREDVERIGYIPSDILRVKPRWPIEAVAMRLTTQGIPECLRRPNHQGEQSENRLKHQRKSH